MYNDIRLGLFECQSAKLCSYSADSLVIFPYQSFPLINFTKPSNGRASLIKLSHLTPRVIGPPVENKHKLQS